MKEYKKKIPFNTWSKERIRQGKKTSTARHKKYIDDPRVNRITPKLPWWLIRDYFWKYEGADSPEELQTVIDGIYKRHVGDHEEFYLHFGDYKDVE